MTLYCQKRVKEYVIKDNLLRRQLTTEQKYILIAILSEVYETGRGENLKTSDRDDKGHIISTPESATSAHTGRDDVLSKTAKDTGVSLTKDEEERILINLFEQGKTQEQIAKVFHVGQTAIAMRVKRNPLLAKSLSDKINISTINEILIGKTHEEVANILKVIKRARVTQIWGDFVNGITELYNTGTPKEEIIQIQNGKNINLTQEKLNELIEEDLNKTPVQQLDKRDSLGRKTHDLEQGSIRDIYSWLNKNGEVALDQKELRVTIKKRLSFVRVLLMRVFL